MDTKKNKNGAKTVGNSKEKATFDQNGAGASDKFGQAGSTPNESGKEGPGTTNKKEKR